MENNQKEMSFLYDNDEIYSQKTFDVRSYLKERPLLSKLVYKNEALFECACEAPSPSKDFGRIEITMNEVIIRWWKITLRNVEGSIYPCAIKNSYEDFLQDEIAHREICRIFGQAVLDHCVEIVCGHIDWFKYLPLNIQIKIFSYLNLDDIPQVSLVSKLFRSISRHNELWKLFYIRQHGRQFVRNKYLRDLAQTHGWRRLFFMNKLKLQMELRRQALSHVHRRCHSSLDSLYEKQHKKQVQTSSSVIFKHGE